MYVLFVHICTYYSCIYVRIIRIYICTCICACIYELRARVRAPHDLVDRPLFRGGLVFKAHRLLYHSTLGLRVIKKEKVRARVRTPHDLVDRTLPQHQTQRPIQPCPAACRRSSCARYRALQRCVAEKEYASTNSKADSTMPCGVPP